MTDTIQIQGNEVTVTTPEGKTFSIPVEAFLNKIAPPRLDTAGLVLPDGIKAVFSENQTTIFVYEAPPRVYSLKWLANNSPVRFGPGAKYRLVRVSVPYLII